jgi:TAP-like protein
VPMPLKQSEVSALLLSGDFDPATPTIWSESVARNMGRGQLALFHGVCHDVIDTTECGGEVDSDFLANPDAKIKSPACRR